MIDDIWKLVGDSGIAALTAGFYRRVRLSPVLAPMYPEQDFDGAQQRLELFLRFRLGGGDDYLHQRGHPRLRMRHAPYPVDRAARDEWVRLMFEAMAECRIRHGWERVAEEQVEELCTFLASTADMLVNTPRSGESLGGAGAGAGAAG